MADGPGLRFRHELVRMAVEASIPPHRTAELHKRLLTALEDRGGADPALLAHHAEGAADAPAVRRHAPEAARRSAALGAHREAAAQFERALRFAAGADDATLAALHEGLGGECALLDRWEEAEATLRSALRLHHDLGDELSAGRNLWMLSKALWRLCRGEEAAETAQEGVRILAGQPASPELAWAYANRQRAADVRRPDGPGHRARRAGLPPGRAAGPAGGGQLRAQHDRVRPGPTTVTAGWTRSSGRCGSRWTRTCTRRPAGPSPTCRPTATRRTGSPRPSASTPRAWPTATSASCGCSPAACWAATPRPWCSPGTGTRPRTPAGWCWSGSGSPRSTS